MITLFFRNYVLKKILIAGYPEQTTNYETAFGALGACPTVSLHVPDINLYDGLVLPGGGDIDPRLFGQLNCGSRIIDPAFDRLQLSILREFVLYQKPVLGICKGMQLINVFFGGDICQNLPTFRQHQYDGADQFHPTTANAGSLLHELYGKAFTVNSAHHQGVDIPGKGIRYIQHSADQVAEGLSHGFLPILGVQWHPERLCAQVKKSEAVDGSLLLDAFLSLA